MYGGAAWNAENQRRCESKLTCYRRLADVLTRYRGATIALERAVGRIARFERCIVAVQIGGKPDSGFDDPLGMLADCHRRIERFLHMLRRVAEQADGRALSAEEVDAVDAALRYFHEAGPRHNRDEEESLFPRLRDSQAAQVVGQVEHLEAEHQQTEALHKEAAELFARWEAEAALEGADRARLRAVTTRLEEIYREHIRLEEEVVFPCAARILDRDAVAAIGAEFKARRA